MRQSMIRIWAGLGLSLGLAMMSLPIAVSANVEVQDDLLAQARQGKADAQRELGKQFYQGQHRPKDLTQAFYWLQQAAKQGDANAQNFVGFLYDTGQGVSENKALAAQWYQRAAYQKYAQAQYNLASLYHAGQGIEKSDILASHWFKLAAQKGHADAQLQLATHYQTGMGVVKDLPQALHWYKLAAAQGNTVAQKQVTLLQAYLKQEMAQGKPVASKLASLQAYQQALRSGQLLAIKSQLKDSSAKILLADPSLAQRPVWSSLQHLINTGFQRGYSKTEINRVGTEMNQVIQLANPAARVQASLMFKWVTAQVFYNYAVYGSAKDLGGSNLVLLHDSFEKAAMNQISMEALKPLFRPDHQKDFQALRNYLRQKQTQLSAQDLNKKALQSFLADAPQFIPTPRFESLYQDISASYRHLHQLQSLAK